ncbi:ribbon-helix-helix protein, CopG family [Novosphingobium rosa]|jgi:metal-responsive CopG/Arc/MetJ family transcriptional regulator|uniref:ribbon-helix-helix protein, CopG family n=1 Tax=Novosphingobium rosa TaxID=76978 RepID=UPI000833A19D|nr:ribbon-helix-helix protein, CopG family [Novosphingobium rosa]
MVVSLRLKDELVAEIDRIASVQGQSRSAWITNVLARAVVLPENDALPLIERGGRAHPDDQIRVTVRLHRQEIEAIDAVGAPLGLSRNEWIKRALRWQLWDKAGMLRLAPITQGEMGKLRKQVLAIGRNINQAVHAMNAANQPGSTLDMGRIAEPFLETCADLKGLLFEVRRSLSSYVGGEVGYWIDAFKDRRS